MRKAVCLSLISFLYSISALTADPKPTKTPAAPQAQVYFISPKSGEKLKSPVMVRFGLKGMGVAPAGVNSPNTGHHHLLINTQIQQIDLPIPNDSSHRHFGAGQTETNLDLPPGKHKLQLVLADHAHIPHAPPVVSEVIEITVLK